MYIVRITYTKSKEAIYIPASELRRILESAMIRAGIYVAYTKDNTPDITFADNIALGIESTAEICDVALQEPIDSTFIVKSLNRELPQGIVILTVETIGDFEPQIDKSAYAVTYEITPKYGDISKMTNREYEDLRAWYRFQMKKYLSEDAILVLVKSMDRSERIDIKPAIMNWDIQINDATRVTVSKDTEYMFNPHYIMDGFKEFVDKKVDYTVKRIKILYN